MNAANTLPAVGSALINRNSGETFWVEGHRTDLAPNCLEVRVQGRRTVGRIWYNAKDFE